VGAFRIVDGMTDAVEKITSLDVNAVAFGQLYRRGLLVVGDAADNRGARNLKLVSWERVIEALGLDALN
jgi:myo-inositol-hexaphosphate 3-phosphohydrolase